MLNGWKVAAAILALLLVYHMVAHRGRVNVTINDCKGSAPYVEQRHNHEI